MAPSSAATQTSSSNRALLITLDSETYAAAREALEEPHESTTAQGVLFERGTLRREGQRWDVCLFDVDPRIPGAEEAIVDSITQLNPNFILLIVLGVGRLASGSVVLASTIDHQSRCQLPYAIAQRVQSHARKRGWLSPSLPSPMLHIGAVRTHDRLGVRALLPSSFYPDAAATADGYLDLVTRWLPRSGATPLVLCGITTDLDKAYSASRVCQMAMELLPVLRAPPGDPGPLESYAPLYVSQILIQDLRSLRSLQWSVPPSAVRGWHVIIGNNGAGKSAALRAIALTLMGDDDVQALRPDWTTWLRAGCEEGHVTITATPLLPPPPTPEEGAVQPEVCISLRRNSIDAGPGSVQHQRDHTFPVLFSAGFGPFRRLSGGDPDLERELTPYPRALRHLTLFSERPALSESLEWLKHLAHRRSEKKPDGALLDQIQSFLNRPGFLPHGTRLAEVSSDGVAFTDGNGARVRIEELSDGFRSVLGLTLELLRHLSIACGPDKIFSADAMPEVIAPGVVLIDEVDAHLHPTWQREIGGTLVRLFPQMQFIVTSHSPLICQAAEYGTVFLLPRPGTEEEGRMLTGVELDRLRYGNVLDAYGTGVFGYGVTRSDSGREKLERLAHLNLKELDAGLSAAEEEEQGNLRAILTTTASVMMPSKSDDDPSLGV